MKRCLVFLLCLFHVLAAEDDPDYSLVNLTSDEGQRLVLVHEESFKDAQSFLQSLESKQEEK